MGASQASGKVLQVLEKSSRVCELGTPDNPLNRTILFSAADDGPFIVKQYLKMESKIYDANEKKMQNIYKAFKDKDCYPNILNYSAESPFRAELADPKDKDPKVMCFRQYVCFNLHDKLEELHSEISVVEKKWLVFQLLCAVSQLHSKDYVHGDIKPENILVNSYNWLSLTDISTADKPVFCMDDNLEKYNKYFGHLDNNERCYMAPERWRSPPLSKNEFDKENNGAVTTKPMDIFSLGCVIAEILSKQDAQSLFKLESINAFRKGLFDPKQAMEATGQIEGPIIDLISKMVAKDPSQRPTIIECMREWIQVKAIPRSFSEVFFQLGSAFLRPKYVYSDNRIALIMHHINSIFEACFGIQNAFEELEFQEHIEPALFNMLQEDSTVQKYEDEARLVPTGFKFLKPTGLPSQPQPRNSTRLGTGRDAQSRDSVKETMTAEQKEESKASAIVIVQWLGNLYTSCFNPQMKMVALEIILKIAKLMPFEFKLNQALPWVMQSFKHDGQMQGGDRSGSLHQTRVRIRSFEIVLEMFEDILDSTDKVFVEQADYQVFSSYILKEFKDFKNIGKENVSIQIAFAKNLGKIAGIGHRFLEISIASSLNRRAEAQKSKTGNMLWHGNTMAQSTVIKRGTQYKSRPGADEDEGEQNSELFEEVTMNYDEQRKALLETIHQFIQDIGIDDNCARQLMLKSMGELAQIFDTEGTYLKLLPHCTDALNKEDYRVRIEALRALSLLSMRLGAQKCKSYILPVVEPKLTDVEDMVVVEGIKMYNQLVTQRLISQEDCTQDEIIDTMAAYLVHPNRQIRSGVARFFYLISEKTTVCEPVLSTEEFYCFVRPRLRPYFRDKQDIFEIKSEKDILDKLKPPLSARLMVVYFKDINNADFVQDNKLNDANTFAYTMLEPSLSKRLQQLKRIRKPVVNGTQESDKVLQLQNKRQKEKVYRIVKASMIEKLRYNNSFGFNKKQAVRTDLMGRTKVEAGDNAAQLVKEYSNQSELFSTFDKVTQLQAQNFGLNIDDKTHFLKGANYEIDQVLRALKVVPESKQTQPAFEYNKEEKPKNRVFIEDTQWLIPDPGPQCSTMQHFGQGTGTQAIALTHDNTKNLTPRSDRVVKDFKPTGTLVTTLYEHKNPVNTVTVCEDQKHFLTGSRKDKKIHIWNTEKIQSDSTSHSTDSLSVDGYVNKIDMIQNSNMLAVASSTGLHIYDLKRIFTQGQKGVIDEKIPKGEQKATRTIRLEEPAPGQVADEVTQVTNFTLPVSDSHVLAYITQNGGFYLQDVRARSNILRQNEAFQPKRGAVSAMCVGQNTYQLTLGTLGGYVNIYDIRYSLVSSQYRHKENNPVLALAHCSSPQRIQNRQPQSLGAGFALVSTGSSHYELSQMNLENGKVEILYRSGVPADVNQIYPEFIKESRWQDQYTSTINRETNVKLYNRALHNFSNHKSFTNLWEGHAEGAQKNIDNQLLKEFKGRYKSLKEAYESQSACCSILVPRPRSSLIFNGEPANFAITGGNDKSLRWWRLTGGKKEHYTINSPQDKESHYETEDNNGCQIVHQQIQPRDKNEFPMYTPAKLMDKESNQHNRQQIEYGSDSAYYQAIASKLTSAGNDKFMDNLQAEKKQQGSNKVVHVYGACGLSSGQHMNDLSMNSNFTTGDAPTKEAPQSAGEQNSSLIYQYRKSETVAHADTILDLGIVEYAADQSLVISCSRDSTVKIWR